MLELFLVIAYIVAMVIFVANKMDDYVYDFCEGVKIKHVVMATIFFPLTIVITIFVIILYIIDFIKGKINIEKFDRLWNKRLFNKKEMK